jgi:hypothetical protein
VIRPLKRLLVSLIYTAILLVPVVGFADAGCRVGAMVGTSASHYDGLFKSLVGGVAGIVLGGIMGFWFCGRVYRWLNLTSVSPSDPPAVSLLP